MVCLSFAKHGLHMVLWTSTSHDPRPPSILISRIMLRQTLSFSATPPFLKGSLPCSIGGHLLSGPSEAFPIAQGRPTRISRADGGRRRANIQLDGVLVLEDAPDVVSRTTLRAPISTQAGTLGCWHSGLTCALQSGAQSRRSTRVFGGGRAAYAHNAVRAWASAHARPNWPALT